MLERWAAEITGYDCAGVDKDTPLCRAAELDIVRTSATGGRQLYTAPTAGIATHAAPKASGGGRWELSGSPEINNAEALKLMLDLYDQNRVAHRNAELFNDTVGNYLTAITLVGSLPAQASSGGAAQPLISASRRKAMGTIVNAVSGLSAFADTAQWFLPCCITDLQIELDPENGRMLEDTLAPQIRLVSARARAESIGVDITRELGSRLMKNLGSKSIGDTVEKIYGEQVKDLVIDYGVTPALEEHLKNLPVGADLVFAWDDIDVRSHDPQRWLEVEADTLGGQRSQAILEQNASDTLMSFNLRAPQAFERQDSLLRFRPNPDEFKSQIPMTMRTKEVWLDYIGIEFEPAVIRLDKYGDNEEILFTARVINSELHAADRPFIELPLEVDPPAAGGITEKGCNEAEGSCQFSFLPTDDFPEGAIVTVRAFSQATSGLRDPSNNPPERYGSLLISSKEPERELEINPSGFSCLNNGETLDLEVTEKTSIEGESAGTTHPEVRWAVGSGGGTVAPSGRGKAVYQAPVRGDGKAVITATTLDSDEPLSISTSVQYGEEACTCYWSGRISGGFGQNHSSDTTGLFIDDELRIVEIGNFGMMNDQVYGFTLDFSKNPIPPGATGTFQATLGNTNSFGSGDTRGWHNPPSWDFDGSSIPPLTVTISQHEMVHRSNPDEEGSRRLKFDVSGPVKRFIGFGPENHPEYLSGQLQATVQGEYWFPMPSRKSGTVGLNCSMGMDWNW